MKRLRLFPALVVVLYVAIQSFGATAPLFPADDLDMRRKTVVCEYYLKKLCNVILPYIAWSSITVAIVCLFPCERFGVVPLNFIGWTCRIFAFGDALGHLVVIAAMLVYLADIFLLVLCLKRVSGRYSRMFMES